MEAKRTELTGKFIEAFTEDWQRIHKEELSTLLCAAIYDLYSILRTVNKTGVTHENKDMLIEVVLEVSQDTTRRTDDDVKEIKNFLKALFGDLLRASK